MSENSTAYHDPLFDNPLLRREAGEGWHPQGLDAQLLGALANREKLLDGIASLGGRENAPALFGELLAMQYAYIFELKAERDIDDPPARMPGDTPGA